jgi:hypothetical protein
MEDPCDYLGYEQATSDRVEAVRALTFGAAVRNQAGGLRTPLRWLHLLWHLYSSKPIRYLDKTIANCFHLEFLERAFPDARYIFLVRDPRANVSSMIQGWPYVGLFGKPQLTPTIRSLGAATVEHWSYPAPPGWQTMLSEPLPRICAWSWQQHVEYALRFFQDRQQDVCWIRYEDLVTDPWPTVCALNESLGLRPSSETRRQIDLRPISRTTITEPAKDKWQQRNLQCILSILPMIKDTASAIGYDLGTDKT